MTAGARDIVPVAPAIDTDHSFQHRRNVWPPRTVATKNDEGGFKGMEIFRSILVLLILSTASAAVCPGAYAHGDTDPWSAVRAYTADANADQVFFYAVDGTLIQWSTRTGRLHTIKECLYSVQALTFSPKKHLLVVGDSVGDLELISVGASPRTIFSRQFEGGINEIVFSPSSGEMLIEQRRHLSLWSVATKKEIWSRDTDDEVVRAAFSSDGSKIAVSLASRIMVLDRATGEKQKLFEMDEIRPFVSDLAFSRNGEKLIAAVNSDLVILDARSGRRQKTLPGKSGDLITVTLLDRGEQGIVVEENNLIQKWDLLKGTVLSSWDLPPGLITNSGCHLVNTTERAGEIELWQLSPQKRLHTLQYKSPKDRPVPN